MLHHPHASLKKKKEEEEEEKNNTTLSFNLIDTDPAESIWIGIDILRSLLQ